MFFSPVGSRRFAYSPAFSAAFAADWQPSSDHAEFSATEQGYTLSLDVPGLAKEQLRIEVDGRVLRVSSLDDAPRRYKAAYRLPQALDAESTTAKLEHGVLTLQLVAQAPVSSAKSVTIQ